MNLIVQVTNAQVSGSRRKYGRYANITILEVNEGVTRATMASTRSKDVVDVVEEWPCCYVGTTHRCEYQRALRDAICTCADMLGVSSSEVHVTTPGGLEPL
jgi:hypothetical protein